MGETQAGNQTKPKIIIKGLPRPVVETHEEFGDMYEPVDSRFQPTDSRLKVSWPTAKPRFEARKMEFVTNDGSSDGAVESYCFALRRRSCSALRSWFTKELRSSSNQDALGVFNRSGCLQTKLLN
jgi:hypothetical protein